MPLLEVKPVHDKWGVYIDGELFALHKNSFVCDFAVHQLCTFIEHTEVNLHADERQPELQRKIVLAGSNRRPSAEQ